MFHNYETLTYPNLEGDDVCGIFATQSLNKDKVVILSGDKDLRTIPGIHHFIHDESTEVVNENNEGILSIEYSKMMGLIVEAIKELNAKIDLIK